VQAICYQIQGQSRNIHKLSDALMLRVMSTHNVPGAALALIKDGNIVLEKG